MHGILTTLQYQLCTEALGDLGPVTLSPGSLFLLLDNEESGLYNL